MPQPEGLVVHVILGISGGVNGVDQFSLRLFSVDFDLIPA